MKWQISLWDNDFVSFGCIPRVESWIRRWFYFNFLRNLYAIFLNALYQLTVLPAVHEGSTFPHILIELLYRWGNQGTQWLNNLFKYHIARKWLRERQRPSPLKLLSQNSGHTTQKYRRKPVPIHLSLVEWVASLCSYGNYWQYMSLKAPWVVEVSHLEGSLPATTCSDIYRWDTFLSK